MKLFVEGHLPYSVMTIAVPAFFYGIYFAKMLMQKRRSIVTEISKKNPNPVPIGTRFGFLLFGAAGGT